MTIDIVNVRNEKVGSLDLSDEVFGGRVKADLIWSQVVHENASRRRGTHATKTRALVSGSGKKPWRQKGTGRARVGEIRNPLWRKGGTVFGPQPRDYGYALPRKMARGALRSAITQRLQDGAVTIVEALAVDEVKTKVAAALLRGWGADGKTLIIDVHPDEKFALSTRNIAGVRLVPSNRVTARDVMDARRLIVSRAAVERLQEVLAS
jgi:large subunit ribosomal protein L4